MSCITDLGGNNFRIDNCVLRYANAIFQPKKVGAAGQERGDPRYSETFILPVLDQADITMLSNACASAVRQKWPNGDAPMTDAAYGAKLSALVGGAWMPSFSEQQSLFKTEHPKFPGRVNLSAKAKQNRPPEIYIEGRLARPDQASQLFGGCIVNAIVGIYCYNQGGNQCGITASLNGIQLVNNVGVDHLDGSPNVAAGFGIDTAAPGFAVPPGAPAATSPPPANPAPGVPPGQAVGGTPDFLR